MGSDTIRTTESYVTFSFPFMLPDLGRSFPAGTYRVLTDEEDLSGSAMDMPSAGQVYNRVATMLLLPAVDVTSGPPEVLWIDPTELDAALAVDRAVVPVEPSALQCDTPTVPRRLGVLQRIRTRLW